MRLASSRSVVLMASVIAGMSPTTVAASSRSSASSRRHVRSRTAAGRVAHALRRLAACAMQKMPDESGPPWNMPSVMLILNSLLPVPRTTSSMLLLNMDTTRRSTGIIVTWPASMASLSVRMMRRLLILPNALLESSAMRVVFVLARVTARAAWPIACEPLCTPTARLP